MLFSIILSCEKEKVEITPLNLINLPQENEVFKIEEEGFYMDVFILDSFLIVTTQSNNEKIHVFNKKNLRLITKFGTDGLAPFELPGAQPLKNASITQDCNSILFHDIRTFQFKTINLNKYLSERNISDCITSTPMDKDIFFATSLTQLDNNKFAVRTSQSTKGMFFIYDTLKKEQKFIEHVPKKNVEDRYKNMLYYGSMNANSSKNSIIYASLNFDQVLFYDLKGNLKRQHIFSPLKIPTLSKDFSGPVNESMRYAVDTYATSEFCFIYRYCYSKNPFDDNVNFKKPTQLLVFTWNGLLVNAFELPYCSSRYRFCYDEEFGFLYLIETGNEENDPYFIIRKYRICDYL